MRWGLAVRGVQTVALTLAVLSLAWVLLQPTEEQLARAMQASAPALSAAPTTQSGAPAAQVAVAAMPVATTSNTATAGDANAHQSGTLVAPAVGAVAAEANGAGPALTSLVELAPPSWPGLLHPNIMSVMGLEPRMMLDMYSNPDHLQTPSTTAQGHPEFCPRHSLPRPLLTCVDRDRLSIGQQLGAGKSKTVHVATLEGRSYAFKSATLPAQRSRNVKQNPFRERRAGLEME
mmetsp:Transcript_42829/g.76935  ORF Transcript_42829/g.76935 Transcript_42829/m.76935 type:complete len:233 (-) Transcript_42829:11-709(-)